MNFITELRLFKRLQPILSQLEKSLHMPFSWNMVLTVALLIVQGIIQFTDIVPMPAKYKWVPIVVHIIAEALLKLQAATHNTDGTSQAVGYTPEKK